MYLMSVSWFVSPAGVTWTVRPRNITAIRSATLQDFGEVVADIDDADAMRGEVACVIDHALALHDGERCGRLVEEHDLRLPVDRARDGDRLALAAGQARDSARLGGNLAADFPQQVRGFAADRPVVDIRQHAEQAPDRLAAEKDIGADGEIVGERQVLIDGLDAAFARLARRGKVERLAGQERSGRHPAGRRRRCA